MSKFERACAAALLVYSMFFFLPATPCWARLNFFDGFSEVIFPNDQYDATVVRFRCNAPAEATSWINRPVLTEQLGPFRYPSGIMQGHNVYPSSVSGLNPRRNAGLPRITDTDWVLRTFLPAGSNAASASAGYLVNITRIDGSRGRSSDFQEAVIYFNPHGTKLQNIMLRANPQNPRQQPKSISFDKLQILPDRYKAGWFKVRARYSDLGLVNNTFVNVVEAYQIGSDSDQLVEFGRFDIRHTFAENLDRVTIIFESAGCVLNR